MSRGLLIGLRAYLTGDNDAELELQAEEAKKFFPDSFLLVSLCGKAPTKKVLELADEVDHYSKKPLGLTPPLHRMVEHAKQQGFGKCILTDGDEQHKFSEIRRIYGTDSAAIPIRGTRSLFFNDNTEADRLTLEEAENAFLRLKHGCMLADPQPGLAILPAKKAVDAADLSQVPSMIGDLALTTQLFLSGFPIAEPVISIRAQEKTRVNISLEFEKVSQLESYYSIRFPEVVEACNKEPAKYLPRGNTSNLPQLLDRFMAWKRENAPST